MDDLITWVSATKRDWLIILFLILILLERLGVLSRFLAWIDRFINHNLKRAADREKFDQSQKAKEYVYKATEAMQHPYNATWLMEQTAVSSEAMLEQLAAYQKFVQETVAENVKLIPAIIIKLNDLEDLKQELRRLEYTQAQARDIMSLVYVAVYKLTDTPIDSALLEGTDASLYDTGESD